MTIDASILRDIYSLWEEEEEFQDLHPEFQGLFHYVGVELSAVDYGHVVDVGGNKVLFSSRDTAFAGHLVSP